MVSTPCVILLLLCSVFFLNTSAKANLQYPLKVAYLDQVDCCSPQNTILAAVNSGYNVIVLAFYQTKLGVADAALSWSQRMDNATRKRTMEQVHAAGAHVIISIGGANDHKWKEADPIELATTISNFAIEFDLDGVDYDLESFGGFTAINGNEEDTIAWFEDAISTTRCILGPDAIISIAPLAPWFGPIGAEKCVKEAIKPGCSWVGPTGGMTAIYKSVGDDIDFFFNQYYNQGSCYTTEAGLFLESGPGCTTPGAYYPLTSVKEVAAQGIPLEKIVIGKPVNNAWAAGSGWVEPATLRKWITSSGKSLGWNAGVGIWEWWDVTGTEATPWLEAVYPGSARPPVQPTKAPATSGTSGATSSATTGQPESSSSSSSTGSTTGVESCTVAQTGHLKCVDDNSYSTCDHGSWKGPLSCQAGLKCVQAQNYVYCDWA